jgi:hypothetical protein
VAVCTHGRAWKKVAVAVGMRNTTQVYRYSRTAAGKRGIPSSGPEGGAGADAGLAAAGGKVVSAGQAALAGRAATGGKVVAAGQVASSEQAAAGKAVATK